MIPAVGRYRVPVGPPSTILLHFEGATIVDSSTNHITVTPNGSAALSTAQVKFGLQSLALSGGYAVANDSRLIVGSQDFTVDCWVYFTALGGQNFILDTRNGGGTDSGFALYMGSGILFYYDGASNLINSSASIPLNSWHHVEVGRSSGVVYMFVDGVLQGTGADTHSKSNSFWVIAAGQFFPIGVSPMQGYMDEFHGLLGTCLHTANFTPPTSPYP